MTAFDTKHQTFVDYGVKKWCISGEIGEISCTNQSVVIASSSGTIARYSISNGDLFPQDNKVVNILKAEGAVASLSMDELNVEGLVGTSTGAIYYVNINEKVIIKLVSKASYK